ncbi:TPA: KxYKxGKxW signal peptide domain-containing protein, partial [Staphylococcus pseudintermedius]
MTKKWREFKKSLSEEKARVKLYKSGKNWVKAGIKEFQLLKTLGLSFLSHDIVKDENEEVMTRFGDKLKKHTLRTTAIAGGMLTANMLHDQHAFAASDAPITSELTTKSQTVGDQTSVVIEKSTSLNHENGIADESKSTLNSENKVFLASQSDVVASESSSLSISNSKSESSVTSIFNTQSVSESTSEVHKSQLDRDEKSMREKHSNHQSEVSSQKENDTNYNTLSKIETLRTSQQGSSVNRVALKPHSSKIDTGYSGFRMANYSGFRAADYSGFRAATHLPIRTRTYTGKGRWRGGPLEIYYKVVVSSDGHNMTIKYTIAQDNPDTSNVEKPSWIGANSKTIKNGWMSSDPARRGQLKLGSGFGRPTIKQGVTGPGYGGWNVGYNNKTVEGDSHNGYYWEQGQLSYKHGEAGYGVTAEITVPIVNPNGNLSWEFHPVAEQYNRGGLIRHDYFEKVWLVGRDPHREFIDSPEGRRSISQSRSISDSESQANSRSVSESQSNEVSKVKSQSIARSLAESQSKSTSDSESRSTVLSKVESTSMSEAASTAKSRS